MDAEIIDGKKIALDARVAIQKKVASFKETRATPALSVTIVGDNPASHSYIRAKQAACHAVGIDTFDTKFDHTISEEQLLAHIETLNNNAHIHGILIQLPLPAHINEARIMRAVSPRKDVDGFHPYNMGLLTLGTPRFEPCTPKGIVYMLGACKVQIASAHVVIVGRSNIVGKPLALMLMRKSPLGNATVTLCHSATKNLAHYTRAADILVVAVGAPHTITGNMVARGATVIDVGINRIEDTTAARGYRLCGDVDFDAVSKVAAKITPVPGGVGPMTIAMLLQNTLEAAQQQMEIQTKPAM